MIGLILAAGSVPAQNMKCLEFEVGTLNPEDIRSGAIWDVKYGIAVDERVDITVGAALFYKSYKKDTKVDEKDTNTGTVSTIQRELEYKSTLLPLTVNATVHMPLNYPFGVYFGAGLAWEFLFNSENNYEYDVKENRTYNGFGWVARAGAEFKLGSRSSLIGEVHYNNCIVKRDKTKKEGLPEWDEVDVTGLGVKIGLRMELY
jgi:opacity protein-like surface antigen